MKDSRNYNTRELGFCSTKSLGCDTGTQGHLRLTTMWNLIGMVGKNTGKRNMDRYYRKKQHQHTFSFGISFLNHIIY